MTCGLAGLALELHAHIHMHAVPVAADKDAGGAHRDMKAGGEPWGRAESGGQRYHQLGRPCHASRRSHLGLISAHPVGSTRLASRDCMDEAMGRASAERVCDAGTV